MNKQLDRILICFLWLLAATLGASFWLNTFFGFNIFSAQHWQYLAYLQAAQTPVRPAFYISLCLCIIITLVVLYLLLRPHGALRRRIRILRARATTTPPAQTATPDIAPATANPTQAPTDLRPASPVAQRPMRPALSTISPAPIQSPAASPMPSIQTPATPQYTIPTQTSDTDFAEIRDIFSSAGYTVKNASNIGNFKPALLAIGTGETLWIGAVGIYPQPLINAIDSLNTMFSDVLEDIEINIKGFIVAPASPVDNPAIQTFTDISQLRQYIDENKNTPPTDKYAQENFDAYSEFIDTVITYIGQT